jgi:hypothetical protein
VSIPSSVGRIDGNAFSYSLCLKEIAVETNNAMYSSVDGVLFDKTGATLLGFPGGKTGLYAIPDGVLRIGDRAFANCAGLTDVTIPEGVAYIGHGAFANCSGLQNMYFMGVAPTFGANALVNCKILTLRYLPAAASGWTNNAYGGRPALLWDSAVGTGDHVAPSGR